MAIITFYYFISNFCLSLTGTRITYFAGRILKGVRISSLKKKRSELNTIFFVIPHLVILEDLSKFLLYLVWLYLLISRTFCYTSFCYTYFNKYN